MKRRTLLIVLCIAALLTAVLLRGLATGTNDLLAAPVPSPTFAPDAAEEPSLVAGEGSPPSSSPGTGRRAMLDEPEVVAPIAATLEDDDAERCSITFQLVPPAATRYDPERLVGRTLELRVLGEQGASNPIEVHVGEGLLIEIPDLPPNCHYVLTEPQGFNRLPTVITGTPGAVRRFPHQNLHPFVLTSRLVPELAPGEHRRVQVALLDGLQIEGRVVDEAGRPIEGADVGLFAEDDAGGAKILSTSYARATDSEGYFSVVGAHPTRGGLLVTRNGFVDEEVPASRFGGGPEVRDLEITLRRGLTIAGFVRLPDGRAVADVEVNCVLMHPRVVAGYDMTEISSTRTDGEGAFLIGGLQELEDLSTFVRLVARAKLAESSLLAKGTVVTNRPSPPGIATSWSTWSTWSAKGHPPVGSRGVLLILHPPRPPRVANSVHPVEAARLRDAGLLDE